MDVLQDHSKCTYIPPIIIVFYVPSAAQTVCAAWYILVLTARSVHGNLELSNPDPGKMPFRPHVEKTSHDRILLRTSLDSVTTAPSEAVVVTMSDDFVRLVSQANPANNQYQQANNGYPPSSSRDQHLDPFFDDEDDDPDSAFGQPPPLPTQSQASGIHLTKNAALPAGVAQPWSFDDEDPHQTYPGSALPSSSSSTLQEKKKKRRIPKIKWEWPWKKGEQVLSGERTVTLNNPSADTEFCSNYITTSKYNTATFLPKFLLGACLLFVIHWSGL